MSEVEEMRLELKSLRDALEREKLVSMKAKADIEALQKLSVGSEADSDKEGDEDVHSTSEEGDKQPSVVYLSQGQRIDRFCDRPTKPGDPSVQEWIRDVRSQLEVRRLGPKDQASLILNHLGGKARKEIAGRGDEVQKDPNSSFQSCREKSLRGRLAEAARDEGVRERVTKAELGESKHDVLRCTRSSMEWIGVPKSLTQGKFTVHKLEADKWGRHRISLSNHQGAFKLGKPVVGNQESTGVVLNNPGHDTLVTKAVGECPKITVQSGSLSIRCLLDTGAEVSTITESFFLEHITQSGELVDVSAFLKISGATGVNVPYIGYVELPITVLGYVFPGMGFLVVKDSCDPQFVEKKRMVPGVLGCNIFRAMQRLLENKWGSDFQDKLVLESGTIEDQRLAHVIAAFQDKEEDLNNQGVDHSIARVCAEKLVLVAANTITSIQVSVQPSTDSKPYVAMIAQLNAEDRTHLPTGLQVAPTLVSIDRSGVAPLQVANFSNHDIYLQPRAPVGIAEGASLGSMVQPARGDLGFCDKVEHRIILLDDKPVKVPHRRIPPHRWKEVRDHLQQLLSRQIIRESSSPYASPVVLVRKKDNSLRMCVDYRALNAKTHRDAYPIPRIEEALDALKGANYFCSLDLAHGYHQVPVSESDIEKTAFRVGTGGLYEFTRMPFGLTNAPATFMRLMDKVFGDENFQTVLIYLDDILVFGRTFQETQQRLEMVLSRLRSYNLKVKPEKCYLYEERLRYLGHIVSKDGILPDPEKTRAIQNWKRPETERELRSFMGLASYYRRFVANFAKIAAPLHALTGGQRCKAKRPHNPTRSVADRWEAKHEEAFRELKSKLTTHRYWATLTFSAHTFLK
ncbi:Transposon Ty3-I Gag-Pol polyprotein [Apostichopus japonicus]|uniref:Transposon Ty3-I Gag-Pol polyprotein n=1 Tax=Stichopus japonicus TaxID=307972 RepID=A0A2G8LE94_STIJA|nr:Transposon Ty3-I Gag-Pol polyprotein [Apostichopus japonicus]